MALQKIIAVIAKQLIRTISSKQPVNIISAIQCIVAIVTDDLIAYHRTRAAGGVGAVDRAVLVERPGHERDRPPVGRPRRTSHPVPGHDEQSGATGVETVHDPGPDRIATEVDSWRR